MNPKKSFIGTLVKKVNHYVLTHYPIVWSINAHYFFLLSFIVGNILVLFIGYFFSFPLDFLSSESLKAGDTNLFLNYLVVIIFSIATAIILIWSIFLNRNRPRTSSIKKYNLLLLCCSSLALNIWIFQNLVTNDVAQLEKNEDILQLEKILVGTIHCQEKNNSGSFIKVDNRIYSVGSTPTFSDEIIQIDSFIKCNEDSLKSFGEHVIFFRDQKSLIYFSKYVDKYNLLKSERNLLNLEENFEWNFLMNSPKEINQDSISSFPIIFGNIHRTRHYRTPLLFITNAKKGTFYFWGDNQFRLLFFLAFILPGLIFIFTESVLFDFILSVFIFLILSSLLSLLVSGGGDYNVSTHLNYVLVFLSGFIVYRAVLLIFSKELDRLYRLIVNIGFFFIPLAFMNVFEFGKVKYEELDLSMILTSIIVYVIFTNIYLYIFVSRKEKHPNRF